MGRGAGANPALQTPLRVDLAWHGHRAARPTPESRCASLRGRGSRSGSGSLAGLAVGGGHEVGAEGPVGWLLRRACSGGALRSLLASGGLSPAVGGGCGGGNLDGGGLSWRWAGCGRARGCWPLPRAPPPASCGTSARDWLGVALARPAGQPGGFAWRWGPRAFPAGSLAKARPRPPGWRLPLPLHTVVFPASAPSWWKPRSGCAAPGSTTCSVVGVRVRSPWPSTPRTLLASQGANPRGAETFFCALAGSPDWPRRTARCRHGSPRRSPAPLSASRVWAPCPRPLPAKRLPGARAVDYGASPRVPVSR
jgi:hypothetical protein